MAEAEAAAAAKGCAAVDRERGTGGTGGTLGIVGDGGPGGTLGIVRDGGPGGTLGIVGDPTRTKEELGALIQRRAEIRMLTAAEICALPGTASLRAKNAAYHWHKSNHA